MTSTYRMAFIICALVASSFKVYAGKDTPAVTLGTATSLQSKVLNKDIPLSIHLPENYDSSNQSYPVIYMMGSEYRARFAMLASTLEYMAGSQIPAMILVGIDLPEGNRILLPARDTGDTKIPDSYINFLETELIPHVENKYRAAPYRMLLGGSNSGLFTTYTLLTKPKLFNSYLASSPSIGAAPELVKNLITEGPLRGFSENRMLHFIYSDDDSNPVAGFVPEFSQVLTKHKPANLTFKVDRLINQGHVPAVDITKFLLAQYPDFNPLENLDSLDKVQKHFDMLSKRYGYTLYPSISTIFNIGVDLTRNKDFAAAEKAFQYSLQLFPKNKRSYVGMGFLRREQGNIEDAKVMFKKALVIDPEYGLAKRLLTRLEG